MKKIISTFILSVLFFGLFTPALVSAQEKIPNCCELSRTIELEGQTYQKGETVGDEGTCNLTDLPPSHQTKEWGLLCLLSSVYVVTDWIFTFLMVLVGVFVIIGAFTLVTSAGDPQRTKSGRDYILYAAIGMAVALLAKAVPAIIRGLLG